MVMNVIDTGYTAQNMETNKTCHKEVFSFNYNLFDDNSLFGNKSINNCGSLNLYEDENIYEKTNMAISRNSYMSETSNFLFNNQPHSIATKWSNGDSSDTVTYQSLPSMTRFDLSINNQNNLVRGSPPGQSRIMSYINNALPAPVSPSISPAQSIESMSVRDFLNHTSGTLNDLELSRASNKNMFNGKNGKLFTDHSKSYFGDNSLQSSFQLVTTDDRDEITYEVSNSDNNNVWSALNENDQVSGEDEKLFPEHSKSYFGDNSLQSSFKLVTTDDREEISSESSNSDDNTVLSALNENAQVSLQLAAPAPNQVKNAWTKPLKFESKTSSKKKSSAIPVNRKPASPEVHTPQLTPFKKVACIGSRVSELDDFDPSTLKNPLIKVQRGGFQVVGGKKTKSNTTKSKGAYKTTNPPTGAEKCSYGGRCLFGTDCSRWHSPEDNDEFDKQKLPNGNRKCPWGAKCFRKDKCINFHSKEDVEQFKN